MKQSILLVEPAYRCKYPPLGLMKIGQYHKKKGDHVEFVKGLSVEKRDKIEWDRIYISTLFTYDWAKVIKTIKYYRYSAKEPCFENVIVGGVLASLMGDEITNEVNCKVVKGRLIKKGILGYNDDDVIDKLIPDYSLLDETDYKYPVTNAYFVHSTRGCIRKCSFCAVPKLEPDYQDFFSILNLIEEVDKIYGPKKDLLLLDNNVLASNKFHSIIKEIKQAGFEKGAKFSYNNEHGRTNSVGRYIDFNQGVDARLLSEEKMAMLSEIALKPLRIAFDSIQFKNIYEEKIKLAAKYGINHLSNYILFNYEDRPEDFYQRLRINLELNKELGLQIFSFPMRYIDLYSKNRYVNTPGNIGTHWNKKYLRAIQSVLNATRGVVGTKMPFFEKAFGRNIDEFNKILMMPEDYIRNRFAHEDDGSTEAWWQQYCDLNITDKEIVNSIIFNNDFNNIDFKGLTKPVYHLLEHYLPDKNEHLELMFTQTSMLQTTI